MIVVTYTTGNNCSCPCCRVTEEHQESFETEQGAIEESVINAERTDWDFYVTEITGAADNEGLEKRIDAAVKQAKIIQENKGAICKVEMRISSNRSWIENAPSEIARRQAQIESDMKELAILKGAAATSVNQS